jgi:transposase
MGQNISVSRHDTIAKLKEAIKESRDEEQKTRIRAIISIKKGKTKASIAQDLVVNRKTVRYWVSEYNRGGTKALVMSKGGRPNGNPVWDTPLFDELTREIDAGGQYWSIPLMQEWIREKHAKDIPESTIWYHLKRLKYSYKSARPHPYKGDKEAQEVFKKRD